MAPSPRKGRCRRLIVGSRSFLTERLLHQLPDLFVARLGGDQPMAFQDAARVGVHHENGVPACIEKNGIGGFRSDAVQRQQFFPQPGGRLRKHPLQRPAILLIEVVHEALQPLGLLAEVARRPDHPCELGQRYAADAIHIEHAFSPQLPQGPLHVRPRRILGQERPHNDLEAGVGGPPVLRSPRRHERLEISPKARLAVQIGTPPFQFSGQAKMLREWVDNFCQPPVASQTGTRSTCPNGF